MSDTLTYVLWAFLLVIQNAAFTYVSRARNSGSLKRHVIAAQMSNGVWFLGQFMVFSQMYKIMTGSFGIWQAVLALIFYTAFTTLGSVTSHWWALRTEKGKARVGANNDLAEITKEQWAGVVDILEKNAELWGQHLREDK